MTKYYDINEEAARIAHTMNSFRKFKEGANTAEYRASVDKAAEIAAAAKTKCDAGYHGKIDELLDRYAEKLAAWYNKGFNINSRVPSIMICGGSKFPTRKKEKQNAARDSHWRDFEKIEYSVKKIENLSFLPAKLFEKKHDVQAEGWKFDGGEVAMNAEENRLQVIFDGRPDEETRTALKKRGFRWAPSQGAWQRQLTNNAVSAARNIFPARNKNSNNPA